MVAFVTIVAPYIASSNTNSKGTLESGIFGTPKVGSRKRVGSEIELPYHIACAHFSELILVCFATII